MLERIEINLLPAEYRVRTTRFYTQREILYPLLFMIVAIIAMAVWTFYLDTQIIRLQKNIDRTEQEIANNKHIKVEIRKLEEQKKLVQMKIRALERIDVNREKWIRLQEVFCQKLPYVTWIEKIEEKSDTASVLAVD